MFGIQIRVLLFHAKAWPRLFLDLLLFPEQIAMQPISILSSFLAWHFS